MGRERGASLEAIEQVYRDRFERFATVAAAIVGSPAGGRDAVQEAFARAVRRRRQFRGDGPLEGWLWQAVVNEARTQRRRVAARERAEAAAAVNASWAPEPDGAAVGALVRTLPERQRLAVFLRYYADLSYEQIAEVLDVRPGTVAASLNAAHTSLRLRLEEAPA
jgi:RNA polymerase sigma-70 factor (ECF subfamily)